MPFPVYYFTADGTVNGTVSIDCTQYFKVEQWVIVAAIGNPTLTLEVKKIISSTQMALGPVTLLEHDDIRTDLSAYTVIAGASVIQRQVFLDPTGNIITATELLDKRCLDVNVAGGNITIINPTINTHIDANATPPDSVRAYGITLTSLQKEILVDANGKIVLADDVDIRNLVKTQDEIYSVLRTDAGIAYDARDIRALTATDVVSSEITKWFGSVAPTVDQKQMTESIPVVIASDQSTLDVDVGNFPAGFNVNNLPSGYDVSDRAGRLLGIIYGSQGAQLKQTPVDFNLAVESFVAGAAIDPRQIRSLTSSDVVTAAQGDNNASLLKAWQVKITDGTNLMPTMDVAARAGFEKITDGTNTSHVSPTAEQLAIYGGNLIYNIDKTSTANIVYIGMALPGSLEANAVWKIMRIDKTASPMRIRMAGGDENFDKIWNNRVGLTYT